MSGFDLGEVYYQSVLPGEDRNSAKNQAEEKFINFIREFRVENNFIYRDQLRRNYNLSKFYLLVNLKDLLAYDEVLTNLLINKPGDYIPFFERAIAEVALQMKLIDEETSTVRSTPFQLQLTSDARPSALRTVTADSISKLVRVSGIVVNASVVTAKATHVSIQCRSCGHEKKLPLKGGLSSALLPRKCEGSHTDANSEVKCPLDPYFIVPDKSEIFDQQTLKLQETPDVVPVGELPRHMLLTADRDLVNRAVPGTRVTVMGIMSIFQSSKNAETKGAVAIRHPYLRVMGVEIDDEGSGRGKMSITEEEEAEFIRLSRLPNLYDTFAASIAPSIYGSADIKKAIACLLFGGSRKQRPDGMKLRGDINVLLLGDPGTAKSQLLKFVEKVAPIAVYTSGKGSSAAGLTASVIRDPSTREFYLEGGAMVLADGGVVCIDEFDKMRQEDRVAIHEAMEQQTISIAKAGITTLLNSRTSVLAAANPIFGRYDDMKTPGENIDFQTTILSRFDMIFIVIDEHEERRDIKLAKHVIRVHQNRATSDGPMGDIDIATMRRYINYVRHKCGPRLTAEALQKLSNHFVSIRSDVRKREMSLEERSTIPITIRQLEAIIRISESLAKMTLTPYATERHVDEALRLFKVSTLNAVYSGQMLEGMARPDMLQEIEKVEVLLKKRLPIGAQTSEQRLITDLQQQGFSKYSIEKALAILINKDELQHLHQRKSILRVR